MRTNHSLKNLISLKNIACLIATFALANSECIETNSEGACIKCSPTQNLQNGNCYVKIRGCLTQQQNQCKQCQNGFVLVNKSCIRQAQYNLQKMEENNNNTVPPVQIEVPPTLTPDQIQNNGNTNNTQDRPLLGGYSPVLDLQDPLFLGAKQFLFANHPQLDQKNLNLVKAEQQIVAGINFRFTYQTIDQSAQYQIIVFRGLNGQYKQSQFNQTENQVRPIPGGYNKITDFNDPRVQKVINFIFKEHANLNANDLILLNGERQIVAGTNYRFLYKKNNDASLQYQITVFQSLNGDLNQTSYRQIIMLPQKPPVLGGYNPITDFNDSRYLEVKKYLFESHPQLKENQLSLLSAQVQTVAGFNYRFVYQRKDKSKRYQVQLFVMLDGTISQNYFVQTTERQDPSSISMTVLNFITSLQPNNFNMMFIQSFVKTKIDDNNYMYQITLYTKEGKMKLIINDNLLNKVQKLQTQQKLSFSSCNKITNEKIIAKNGKIQAIQKFLKAQNVKIPANSQLTTVQVSFRSSSVSIAGNYISYKLLYTTQSVLRTGIWLKQASLDQFEVQNIQVIDRGFQIISSDNESYQMFKKMLQKNQVDKFADPFLTPALIVAQTNGIQVRGLYQLGKVAYQGLGTISSNFSDARFIKSDQIKVSLPIGYDQNNIINLSQAKALEYVQTADKIFRSQYGHYINDAQLSLVYMKDIGTLQMMKLLYKTRIGYFEGIATYNPQSKQVKFANFVLTGVKNLEVSTCRLRDKNGKCIQCNENEILSLDNCFSKINNCQAQVGKHCYLCGKYSFSQGGQNCDTTCGI